MQQAVAQLPLALCRRRVGPKIAQQVAAQLPWLLIADRPDPSNWAKGCLHDSPVTTHRSAQLGPGTCLGTAGPNWVWTYNQDTTFAASITICWPDPERWMDRRARRGK